LDQIKKIVVIGPESTGKSTLSAALAERLQTIWVKEFAREYLVNKKNIYDQQDLLAIAKGQVESENQYCQQANKYLICDTDLYVLKVWSEHKYGTVANWILEQIAIRKYDFYVLCDIDMPWIADEDAQREHGDPEMRFYFYNIYKDIVQASGIPWINVSGNEAERLEQSLAAIRALK
jgi:NadR type nicotinamide-nucleotide adenylyltransferase